MRRTGSLKTYWLIRWSTYSAPVSVFDPQGEIDVSVAKDLAFNRRALKLKRKDSIFHKNLQKLAGGQTAPPVIFRLSHGMPAGSGRFYPCILSLHCSRKRIKSNQNPFFFQENFKNASKSHKISPKSRPKTLPSRIPDRSKKAPPPSILLPVPAHRNKTSRPTPALTMSPDSIGPSPIIPWTYRFCQQNRSRAIGKEAQKNAATTSPQHRDIPYHLQLLMRQPQESQVQKKGHSKKSKSQFFTVCRRAERKIPPSQEQCSCWQNPWISGSLWWCWRRSTASTAKPTAAPARNFQAQNGPHRRKGHLCRQ